MTNDEKAEATSMIEPGRRALLEQVWEYKKVAGRAWACEMAAMHKIIGDPAHAEAYEQQALLAADEHTEASRQADLLLHEIDALFPRQVALPDAASWMPAMRELVAALAGQRDKGT